MINGKDNAWNKRSRVSSAPVPPTDRAYGRAFPVQADGTMATTYDSISELTDMSTAVSGIADNGDELKEDAQE